MNTIKIIPFEKMNYNDNEVAVDDVIVTYCQTNDCTESRNDVQTITLSARNNGVGRFVNIKTESWSIDEIEDLVKLIKDFKKRANL